MRMIFHRAKSGFSVGAEVDDDRRVWVAVAACHPRDEFRRKVAFNIVNGRLDRKGDAAAFKSNGDDNPAPSVVCVGKIPMKMLNKKSFSVEKDVFGKIRDFVRNYKRRRDLKTMMRRLSEVEI